MKKKIMLSFDEEILEMIEREAQKNEISVASFLERAALLQIVKDTQGEKQSATQQESRLQAEKKQSDTKKMGGRTMEDDKLDLPREFAKYLNERLNQWSQEYEWSFELEVQSRTAWLDPNFYSGKTNEDSARLLSLCSRKIREALINADEQLAFETIRIAMDWGGVYYDYQKGPQKGNEAVVRKLVEDKELLSVMKRNDERIIQGDIMDLDYYTSGWSIVWYILQPDRMMIIGSREMYGLNQILNDFKQLYKITKLPPELNFGQLVYKENKRYIPGVKYVYTLRGKLRMVQKMLMLMELVKELGDYTSSHIVDRKLFMIGQ